ncbi:MULTISPECIES: diguanylate cyclase domain-containing protein [Thalassospira]|uniref:Diguanylate cyclase n=1 Tax=Thalassospira aquimaris TaxID=3037796 RepID=A0ABT6GAG2_9PROT|nr:MULTISPECIES: diguanylate cyclase [Thalassospira]MDG4719041.1 diguanylate cyclase [Thalassospira sp. FZY0004]
MIKLGHLKSFMVCFAPLSAVFLLVVSLLAWEGSLVREKVISDDQRYALEKSISVLRERIDIVVSDLLILSESQQVDAVISGTANLHQLADEFAIFSLRRGIYDQIRFLDLEGKEVVRVNYGSGIPFAVPQRELQDKSDRPYFRLAENAPRGTIYISGVDLNEEFGQIEKPIKPVIRLSAPVFDKFGERHGVVVLNMRAAPIFADVVQALQLDDAEPFVLDDDGGWILGGEEGENWSEDLTGKAIKIGDRLPQAWESMQLGLQSFRVDSGFYSVQRLDVSDLLLARNSLRSLSVIYGSDEEKSSRLNLYVGARLPVDVLDKLLWPERGTLIIVSLAFLFLIAIGSAAYAWTRQNQIVASFDARLSEQVLRASKNSVVVADQEGTILKVNPGFTAMTGYLPNEAVGKPLSFLRAQRENAEALDEILMSARANGIWEGEVRNRRKGGDFFYSNVVISAITDPTTSEVNFVEMGLDISRHMENAQELWRQANHDALTGLPNRLLFEDRLEVACGHAENEGHSVALLYIDLDGFKPVNDRYGHEIGDQVLRKVGERIKNTIRQGDTVARLGGDEFAVIADDVKGRDEAEWVAQKIAASVQRPIEIDALSITVGASIGLAIFPQDCKETVALLGLADEKMYQQKRVRKSKSSDLVSASR